MASNDDVVHGSEFAVRWRDFRAFADTGWVILKPLTLLLGPNSAGKSSFIAPLLLLKQSIYSRTGTNALLTRGEYLDVGNFEDFVREHDVSAQVLMGLRWHSHPPHSELSKVGHYAPGGVELVFEAGPDPQDVTLRRYRVEDIYRRQLMRRERQRDGGYSIRMSRPPPAARRRKRRRRQADIASDSAMRRAIDEAQPTDFLFRSPAVRQAGVEARLEADAPNFSGSIDDDRARFYCSITDYTEWGVRSILDDLHYIGPLREPPRRVYELSGEMPDEVGTRGEFAPEIVYRWRRDKPRMRAVQKWLAHFGFTEQLDFKAVGTGGFSLMLLRDGAPVASTFVDTGFGMSQVLPLIVQGLLATEGETLVIEQPEIHLNPRLQAGLADLFADIVRRKIRLLIESHSEHLLLRLRRLIAADQMEPGAAGLYFIEQQDGQSLVRDIPVGDDGFIAPEVWPDGFFEDSLREAMSLAQAQANARRRRMRRARQEARSGNGKGA